MSKKNFDLKAGKYYFTIKAYPNGITIHRESRDTAHREFLKYRSLGKPVEWNGKWDGKQFTETKLPADSDK